MVPAGIALVLVAALMASSVTAAEPGEASHSQEMDGGVPNDVGGEPNDVMGNATEVETSQSVNATLSSGSDADWYAVNATSGDSLIAELALRTNDSDQSIKVELFRPTGERIAEYTEDQMHGPQYVAGNGPFGEQELGVAADVAEGNRTYYVRVTESQWAETDENASSPYTLSVRSSDLDRYDPNENSSVASTLSVGDSVNATAASYDHDVYAVDVEGGENVTVSVRETGESGSAFSSMLAVTTNASADVATNPEDGGSGHRTTGSTFVLSPDENETYYLVYAEADDNAALLGTENYTLTVEDGQSSDGDDVPLC
ncbi:hypothetical protein HUG10_02610 [Halorarum halophilum]|uniref:Uncharacterized protein n=1 Tax=Halorarum halophilum TaxID=2743090 RepID=A0A7D5KWE3_9EURY|nr:hypothetical protein [Halobaculum halophilum]QLG26498.1 hypothetical protein HUG10_02610 [Halobaculum halophilum]